MFVLLEAFDEADLRWRATCVAHARRRDGGNRLQVLIGVNCRDLQTLEVVPERFETLAPQLPAGWPAVAESGVASAADALRMQKLGYQAGVDRHRAHGPR